MRANPGGSLAPNEVIGRDELISKMWDDLMNSSVYMHAERRVGKTQVGRKMEAEPREGFVVVYRDFEQVNTPQELTDVIYDVIQKHAGNYQWAANWFDRTLERFKPSAYVDVTTKPWKFKITEMITEFIRQFENKHPNDKFVLILDEVPFMLLNVINSHPQKSPEDASAILSLLRSLQQNLPALRMIYTGSIGIHHVINLLYEANFPTQPTNQMVRRSIGPLSPDNGKKLAKLLLEGEKIKVNDIDVISSYLSTSVGCYPFYIHHLVRDLRNENEEASEQTIDDLITKAMTSPDDPWSFRHLSSRIKLYFKANEKHVNTILDFMASHDEHKSINDILNTINLTQPGLETRTELVALLDALQADHYIERLPSSRTYQFRFPLLKRWWQIHRGL